MFVLPDSAGNVPPMFYLVNANQAFALDGSNVDSGFFQSQTGGPFSNTSATGTYAFGTTDPQEFNVNGQSGVAVFATPNVTVTNDKNSNGTLQFDQTGSMTYSIDSTGLGLLPSGCSISVTPTTCQTVFYIISPTKAAVMDTTSSNPEIQLADK
jgi:hypothetical protein